MLESPASTSFDLRGFGSHDEALRGFEWDLPKSYNIAVDVCDRHASTPALAAQWVNRNRIESATFGELADASNRLASSLATLGLGRGDRVATALANRIETLVVFLAIAKLGAVAVTLRWHDSQELYRHELGIARPDALIYDAPLAALLAPLSADKPFICAASDTWDKFRQKQDDATTDGLLRLLLEGDPSFCAVETSIDDPLLVSFTSGSTGLSKAVTQAHRLGRAQRPAFQMATNLGPRADDVFFTNLGWATMGGLRSIIFPAWQFGRPVVACGVEDASIEAQCDVLTQHHVTVAYLVPAVLKQIRQLGPAVREYDWSALRVIISSGEGIGAQLQDWLEGELGAAVHSCYGQTELAVVVSSCQRWFPSKPGSVGRLVPGHTVTFESGLASGNGAASQALGTVVVPADDPSLFLGYLKEGDEGMPRELGHPYDTGDVLRFDDDGDFYYAGRLGDVIELPSGRTVAAAELEDAAAGVVGVLDVAAVKVPAADGRPVLVMCLLIQNELVDESVRLINDVRQRLLSRLSEDAWPEELAVMTSFPRTTLTNKVNRKLLRDDLVRRTADGSLVRYAFRKG
jgi:acetyl-CoA synthetase